MKIRLFTVPNLLTLMSLMCGSFAALAALGLGDLRLAFWLLIAAALFDFADGFTARLLGCPSAIGVQLDSLADMISFGFAPASILVALYLRADALLPWDGRVQYAGALLLYLLTAFSALRLAKFNLDETQRAEFCGLPTPAAALLCASLGLIEAKGGFSLAREWLLLLAVGLGLLLISPIRMFALKFHGFGWRGNELRYLFLAACAVLIFTLRTYAIPAIVVLYIVISTVRWLVRGRPRG